MHIIRSTYIINTLRVTFETEIVAVSFCFEYRSSSTRLPTAPNSRNFIR